MIQLLDILQMRLKIINHQKKYLFINEMCVGELKKCEMNVSMRKTMWSEFTSISIK